MKSSIENNKLYIVLVVEMDDSKINEIFGSLVCDGKETVFTPETPICGKSTFILKPNLINPSNAIGALLSSLNANNYKRVVVSTTSGANIISDEIVDHKQEIKLNSIVTFNDRVYDVDENYVIINDIDGYSSKITLKELLNNVSKVRTSMINYKYTKNDGINKILSLCGEPADYNKDLAKILGCTEKAIYAFIKSGCDVYVDVLKLQIIVLYPTSGKVHIDCKINAKVIREIYRDRIVENSSIDQIIKRSFKVIV